MDGRLSSPSNRIDSKHRVMSATYISVRDGGMFRLTSMAEFTSQNKEVLALRKVAKF